jgi:ABC-type cobalamin transport system permease subunit
LLQLHLLLAQDIDAGDAMLVGIEALTAGDIDLLAIVLPHLLHRLEQLPLVKVHRGQAYVAQND